MFVSWQEGYDKPRQCVEKQRHYSNNKGPYSQGYSLSSGHVWLWELNSKEGEAPKNWLLQTVVLEKTPESPLDSKKIKPINLKGNQPWILGRTDAETETPVFWSSDMNSWLTGKVPEAGKDWGQQEKRVSEDEMAGWHHQCNGYELGQTGEMVRDREAWHAAVHGVVKRWTWLGSWTTTCYINIFLKRYHIKTRSFGFHFTSLMIGIIFHRLASGSFKTCFSSATYSGAGYYVKVLVAQLRSTLVGHINLW